ncbi:MAG: ornithine carbamoyltransferase [Terriglobia bacterium]
MTPAMAHLEVPEKLSVSDLIAERDLSRQDLDLIFNLAARVKSSPASYARALQGKQLALLFEKPSLRTRVTFEVGMTSMGGFAVILDHSKPRLGERESVRDVARNLERWVNGMVARTFSQATVEELAEVASVPVINGLTDRFHPCQALADFFTLEEKFGKLRGCEMAFIGDGNNMAHSLMMVAAKLGVSIRIATPPGYEPQEEIVREAKRCAAKAGAKIRLLHNPLEAASGAHAVYTDVWTSMGQEHSGHLRAQVFAPFRVTESLMAEADPEAVFMHCLPAHRGEEVMEAVIDSARSIVFDQAENRLHVQKAILLLLLQGGVE